MGTEPSGGSLRYGGEAILGGPPGWRWAKGNIATWVVSTLAPLFNILGGRGEVWLAQLLPISRASGWLGMDSSGRQREESSCGGGSGTPRTGTATFYCLFEYFICGRCSLLGGRTLD